jgi:hypothetical protein
MTTEESDYSLKESFDKIGALPIPRFEDLQGHDIDGLHRKMIGANVPVIKIPVKNAGQLHVMRLVINFCRRKMTAEEISDELAAIAKYYGWNAKQIAEKLPFSYDWVAKYLPDEYKDPVKAKAGTIGGQARAEAYRRKSALRRQAKSEDTRQPLHPESVTMEPSESEEEFAKRFTSTFTSHITQLTKKDLPIIITYLNEEHNCGECRMKSACSLLLDSFMSLQEQLPNCMRTRLNAR